MALKSYAIAVTANIVRNNGGHISRVCIGHQVQDSLIQARKMSMEYIPQVRIDPQDTSRILEATQGPSAAVMSGGRTIGFVQYDARLRCYTYSDHMKGGIYRLNSDGSLGQKI